MNNNNQKLIVIVSLFYAFINVRSNDKFLSLNIYGGQGYLNIQNLTDLSYDNDYIKWQVSDRITFGAQIEIGVMLNSKIGLSSGIGFNNIKTVYTLSSDGINSDDQNLVSLGVENAFFCPEIYYFNNGSDAYNKIIQVFGYDSTLKINTINIPVNISYYLGNNVKFIFKTGVECDFVLSSKYNVKSSEELYYIFLPEVGNGTFPAFIYPEDGNVQEINLYRKSPYKAKDDIESLKKIYINGVLNVSMAIPFNEKLNLIFGGTYKFSLTDLNNDSNDYIDIFGRTEDNPEDIPSHVYKQKPVKNRMLVFQIGLKYKF